MRKVGENGQIRPVYDTVTKRLVFLHQIVRYDTARKRAVYTLYTAVNAVQGSELQIWSLRISSFQQISAHNCVLAFL
jgi:hypothetical protein